MSSLDADVIRQFTTGPVSERLANIKVFAEIDSTNSYLMQMPGPDPGAIIIAVTSNQTAGRGRHGKSWQSPPGSGLCLSAAYTFAQQPDNLPALTLALGLGAVDALEELGANGVELKWPNDLVARDGKLGGILTEVQRQSARGVSVVTGIGLNIDLQGKLDLGMETDWAKSVVDLNGICETRPSYDEVAARITSHWMQAFMDFEASGFAAMVERWARYDWLKGRDITIDTAERQLSGVGAGIADDGALLIDTLEAGTQRVTSGSIIRVGLRSEVH